ncbi:MAG: AAA family ATPase [Chloroflexi bacterium]|nr:AAA family ATPase [Chloroflexota bacterium]
MKELLAQFASAIAFEIALLEKENANHAYELLSGHREEKSTGTLYIFLLADALRLPEEAPGTLKVEGRDVNAMVVSQEGNRIWLLLESLEPLPDYIASARLVLNETDLLKRLKEQIEALKSSSEFGLAPKVFGFESSTVDFAQLPVDPPEHLAEQGKEVLRQCAGSEVTFVWGPPGTGKTYTIAALVASLASSNETVLVTSHTHAAVEQALWTLVEPPSDGRRAGLLYGNRLVGEGRILKVGDLKSSKIPPRVHLESYLETKAKEREENVRILDEERERIARQIEQLKSQLAPWLEMEQAELAHHWVLERYESVLTAKDVSATEVVRAKTALDRDEATRLKAEHSFFIGRHGRVRKALEHLGSTRQALTRAVATAGQAEADAIRAERTLAEANARLVLARQTTQGLTPSDELHKRATNAQERVTTLESEIRAIRATADDDARQLVQNAAAIFATLTKLYIDRNLLHDMKWDTVIVDEVSMVMPPLLAYAASRARKRVVLVGDMFQLPPVVHSERGSDGEILRQDIFELRHITEAVESQLDFPGLAKLTTQRRMHPHIAAVAKVLIDSYSHLEDHHEVLERKQPAFVSATETDGGLAVIDISDLLPWSGKMPGSLSRFNFISGQAAIELSALYAARLQEPEEKTPPPIGIVTPYVAQRRYLNKLIQMFGLGRWVAAGTVHTFQGSECDVVIFDSVLGEPHWTSRFTNPKDWREVRRDLNVAVTRARHQFVFVGDTHWLDKHAGHGSGYGKLWSFLKDRAVMLKATDILGEGFKERVAKTVSGVKGWDLTGTEKALLLTEVEFYKYFITDLMKATHRVVLYTPFIGKTRWPSVAPSIALLCKRGLDVFLLHKPLTDPEWKQGDRRFGKSILDWLSSLGVKLIPLSGVHAKTIVIDSKIVYEGSLNWASQTSSYEHMWRFPSREMALLVEKMLQLDPIIEAFGEEEQGHRCPNCAGPLILINRANQNRTDPHPLQFGCARWSVDKKSCTGYLRSVDARAPFLIPPSCSQGTRMQVKYTKGGHPWDWRCGHRGCRPIRWVRGDCLV